MIRLLVLFCCLALIASASARPFGGVNAFSLPSYDNAEANWQNAGLLSIGGIPSRTTQCGSTISPTGITPPATGDDADTINAAISACTTGDVVKLASGTFELDMTEHILLNKGVVLRGSDTCPGNASSYPNAVCGTVINVDNGTLAYTGGDCGTDTSHIVTCPNGGYGAVLIGAASPDYNWSWAQCGNYGNATGVNCGGIPIAADVAQGDTTIQVASTTNFTVGAWVKIDEASGAGWVTDPMNAYTGYGEIWADPALLTPQGSTAISRVLWGKSLNVNWDYSKGVSGGYPYQPNTLGCSYAYCDRITSEMHKVASIGAGPCPGANCTVTFDDPLTVGFRVRGGASFTGSTNGTTTLTVVSGSPVIGQIASDGGVDIPLGDYISACTGSPITSCTLVTAATGTETSVAMTSGDHQAQVYPQMYTNQSGTGSPTPLLLNAGLEDLSVMRAVTGGVEMQLCQYCWIKNVEVGNWYGGGIKLEDTVRSEVVHSYVHHAWDSVNNGGEYAIAIDQSSTEDLVDDNIVNFAGKGIVGRGSSPASVVSYNYFDDTMYDGYSGIGDYWVDTDIDGSHFSSPHQMLFEGNWSNNLDSDNTHGSASLLTYFRNQGTGVRTPFTDPSINKSVDDATGTGWYCTGGPYPTAPTCTANTPGFLRGAGPMSYSYDFAMVSNVLGLSGVTTSANGWTYTGDWSAKRMISPGWNDGGGGQDPYLNGTDATLITIEGNYDYVDAAVVSPIVGVPSSLYLSAEPAYYGASGVHCIYAWPGVTPGTTPLQTPTGTSCTSTDWSPAKARWDAGTPFVQP